ncbi:hypothetical protein [Thermospira aquatica]|uniref:Uncharacterized protein n=1 Tax=Thermospira aquatica TaxID=2828656 RepID=A0AAX3BES8_9SPIR|nr:hypothetical protein [Thermospira aquatica]URA10775.1 hypothetical protein KDW03_02940 [Thermospira aquatica]
MRYVSLVLFTLFSLSAFASFEDIGWTMRSKGMGNAIFGDFDGVNTMHYNPATISMTRSIQLYTGWNTPYVGFDDNSMINIIDVNLVAPFWNRFTIPPDSFFTKRGAIGLSFHRLSLIGPDGLSENTVEYYHEGVYSLIYAKDLNDVLSRGAKISLGTKLSLYDIGVGGFEDTTANPELGGAMQRLGFGVDVGATYDFSETIRLGLVYKNLISPNVSILPDGQDVLPSELRIGANMEMGNIFFMKKAKLGIGYVSYGREWNKETNDNRQSDSSWHVGYEFWQLTAADLFPTSLYKGEMLAVRVGMVFEPRKVGDELDLFLLKLTGVLNFTFGLGFTYVFNYSHQVTVDSALQWGVNMGKIEPSVGLQYQFLLPNSAFAYREEEIKARQLEEEVQKRQEELRIEELKKQKQQTNTQTNAQTNTTSTLQSSTNTTTTPPASSNPTKKKK